ncbi:uncharacterized protein LOC109860773 [Pseudomyrmex gracilis]|uniref:uncharacterized protein LOC109860773 n=1 Tax=Pseudomyrmex gracilis TaxID=219809 RepID=UPI000994C271|nr:uncharacterized protein LOC109860773 [Pseudomyrmex gracilis]
MLTLSLQSQAPWLDAAFSPIQIYLKLCHGIAAQENRFDFAERCKSKKTVRHIWCGLKKLQEIEAEPGKPRCTNTTIINCCFTLRNSSDIIRPVIRRAFWKPWSSISLSDHIAPIERSRGFESVIVSLQRLLI